MVIILDSLKESFDKIALFVDYGVKIVFYLKVDLSGIQTTAPRCLR